LSVVVVSSATSDGAIRAVRKLNEAARGLAAEVIVVAPATAAGLNSTVEQYGAELVAAPVGCSRAEMCDLGMSRASGSIVAVRDDVDVGDALWLDAYRGLVGLEEQQATVEAETLVMDMQVPAVAQLADVAPATAETRRRVASIEMAAAV
jgi:hypothetical protein